MPEARVRITSDAMRLVNQYAGHTGLQVGQIVTMCVILSMDELLRRLPVGPDPGSGADDRHRSGPSERDRDEVGPNQAQTGPDKQDSAGQSWTEGGKGGVRASAPDSSKGLKCEEKTYERAQNGATAKSGPHQPKYPDAFTRFWNTYPRKQGKQAALKAWKKTLQSGGVEANVLLISAQEFAASPAGKRKDGIVPHPATWLNEGRWEDDRATWQIGEHRDHGNNDRLGRIEAPAGKYAGIPGGTRRQTGPPDP